jgi:hypothetical protein
MAEEEQEGPGIYEDEEDDCVSINSADDMDDDEWAEQDELENNDQNLYNSPLDNICEILEFAGRFSALEQSSPEMYNFLI